MKNKILLTESEKERILGLHRESIYRESKKRKYLKESNSLITEENGENKDEYPPCVQNLGDIIGDTDFYSIMGKGEWEDYFFYNNSRVVLPSGKMDSYYCVGDKVVIGRPFAKFPCVPNHPKAQKKNLESLGLVYIINGTYYFDNGRKMLPDNTKANYTCNDPEFKVTDSKPKRIVPTTADQLLKGGTYLMLKDKNDLVTQVQSQLIYAGENVQKTGTFDQQTKDAVKSYQGRNNLKPDGIVGKLTWGKLSKVLPYSDETIARKEITQIPTSSTPKDVVPLTPPTPSQSVAQVNPSVTTGTAATTTSSQYGAGVEY